jgi:hypothetical protein
MAPRTTTARKTCTPLLHHAQKLYDLQSADPLTCYHRYPVHPEWWLSGAGAWHGFSWIEMVRPSEIADGDDLFSPFVAAGWSIATENNFRPAQWLGMLKILGVWGAEFFYTGASPVTDQKSLYDVVVQF